MLSAWLASDVPHSNCFSTANQKQTVPLMSLYQWLYIPTSLSRHMWGRGGDFIFNAPIPGASSGIKSLIMYMGSMNPAQTWLTAVAWGEFCAKSLVDLSYAQLGGAGVNRIQSVLKLHFLEAN